MRPTATQDIAEFLKAETPFMESGLALTAASRNASNRPSTACGLACRVLDNGAQFMVVIRPSQCPNFLSDVREHGVIAVACAQVGSNRSLQIKGRNAKVGAVAAFELGEIVAQTGAFVEAVVSFDHLTDAMMRAYVHFDLQDLAAVKFTPDAIFTQTPGPDAGARILCR